MANFDIPDLRTLIADAESDIEAELPGTDARLRRSNLNVLARVKAGFAHGMFGFIREFLKQCLPWSKGFLLRQWAEIWGVFQNAATFSSGFVILTGVDLSPIDAGTRLQTTDGREYAILDDVSISGTTATAQVVAVVAGAAGNLASGATLNFVLTVDGVAATATVGPDGVTNGTDDESPDRLYARYQQRVQNPAHGGNDEDYKGWAMETGGVTRAWVYGGLDGVDTVQLYFVRDDDAGSIIPDAAAVATVEAYIKAPNRKPVTARVGVYAPTPKNIDFTIKAVPNTPEVRAAIVAELKDLIRREGDLAGTLLHSHMDESISLAAGEMDHTLVAPTTDVVCAMNEIHQMGNITWI